MLAVSPSCISVSEAVNAVVLLVYWLLWRPLALLPRALKGDTHLKGLSNNGQCPRSGEGVFHNAQTQFEI